MTPGGRLLEASECVHEAEVLEALAFGRWPDRGGELSAHVSGCEACADLMVVARALHDDRAAWCRKAQPPAAGMVWWRATIRARAEAVRTVAQPISVLQGIAGACLVGAAAGLATVAWQSVHRLDRIAELAVQLASRRADIAAASALAAGRGLPILVAVAGGLVLAPLAIYFTLADD
ncbi:MAG: hypothetical protein ABJC89_23000 [Acidobacteriota bacterium]